MITALQLMVAVVLGDPGRALQERPLSSKQRTALAERLDRQIERLTAGIRADPKNVRLYSRRGDARFFRGRFRQAADDYQKMVDLNPKLATSHWRRGIAWFYAGQYKKAAHQFEIYNTFDNVDRENGIWRFLSQVKAHGIQKARQGLLKYEKDDREPFPSVYKLFSGDTTPQRILAQIREADISDEERAKRSFYAHLYIGLHYDISGKPDKAVGHLDKAADNSWAPEAGFGPSYMWHVARLHYERLTRQKAKHKPNEP